MEHTVNKQQMDTLRALAETTIKVSEAKATLIKLEETETEYLESREKKAMERIQKLHVTSAALLEDTQLNYHAVQHILNVVGEAANFIGETYARFSGILSAFDERNKLWEANCDAWEAEAERKTKELIVQQASINSQKAGLEEKEKAIGNDRRKVDDMRATLERAIERLKENRI